MNEPLQDQAARDRFRDEWDRNFAVSANAGSGKTTAISERIAALALAPGGDERLRRTAVVTFTRKAADQIGQRAREVLLRRLAESGRRDLAPLDDLERAFFGTIHSFCVLLAQRHGQTLGLNLNPAAVGEDEDALWAEFLEQDAMQFTRLAPGQVDAFLRHVPLESIFSLANRMGLADARRFVATTPAARPPEPAAAALQAILAATTRQGKSTLTLARNQEAAKRWIHRFRTEAAYLPLPKAEGKAAGIDQLYARFFAPVKGWLAEAAAVLAAELALRYRAWRFDRGVQTYADQVEAAMAVLQNPVTLEKIRAENWRVLLDEAQDTDPQQFAVLVEITRPAGAVLGSWPGSGPGPRPGHFCLVGDGQQAIYGSRADIRNFQRHLDAFGRGDGGERLTFAVTFRAPHQVIELLNETLPPAFGAGREHNLGLPPAAGVAPPLLQVKFEPLEAGPANLAGAAGVLRLAANDKEGAGVEARLAAEARQIALWLKARGPAGVGVRTWGEICLLAPRNDWLVTARKELEALGLKTALQMRKNRNGDNPAFAWVSGLLAAVCAPDNRFEWVGVLREIFGVSDAEIAATLREREKFHWDEPDLHPEPVRSALAPLQPLMVRVDAEAEPLGAFAADLARAGGLAGKARLVDPSGGLEGELERLLAQAAELGLEGAGPREWLRELLADREEGRPAGRPSPDAINLLTAHSAKGLEWPVVVPIGLWRMIGAPTEDGLRLVSGAGTEAAHVYFDRESVPEETRQSRERERLRELVRLLYVTLTRARRALVLPWPVAEEAEEGSFAALWGANLWEFESWSPPRMSEVEGWEKSATLPEVAEMSVPARSGRVSYPARLLPHQLARQSDFARSARHESAVDDPRTTAREDPIEYGLWWHETMEFLPWAEAEAAVEAHLAGALVKAEIQGFRARADEEIGLLRASGLWRDLRSGRWLILSELSVLAPLGSEGWVDGVIDLVAHDQKTDEFLVIDWKTNRIRKGEPKDFLLRRLVDEYRPQLEAYGSCLRKFYPTQQIRLGVYGTGVGGWRGLDEVSS